MTRTSDRRPPAGPVPAAAFGDAGGSRSRAGRTAEPESRVAVAEAVTEAVARLLRGAVADGLRDLLAEEPGRRDQREDLGRRRRADRIGFAAQVLAEAAVSPSPCDGAARPDPRAAAVARSYRAAQRATGRRVSPLC